MAYLLAFPVAAFGMLAWVAAKAVMKSEKARPVAMLVAAPVVAPVFVTVGPIVGLALLARASGEPIVSCSVRISGQIRDFLAANGAMALRSHAGNNW